MKQEVLSHFDLTWLPLTALILFIICFAAYTYWAYKKSNIGFFENMSQVPLNDAKKVNN